MKKVLIAVPTYEGKKYCQDEFFERLANLEVPDGCETELLVVVNSDDMVLHSEYYREIIELCEKIGLNATVANVDFPYPYGGQTRVTFFHNVIRGYCLELRFDHLFSVEADVMVEPDTLVRLLKTMEANDDAGVVGGTTMYETEDPRKGDKRPVMVFRILPEDELAIMRTKYALPIVRGGKAGWQNIQVPILTPMGAMVTIESYSKEEILAKKEPFDCEGISLGCTLIRSTVLNHIMFRFNPSLRYYSDAMFCIDVRKDGWRIMCDPSIFPRHLDAPDGRSGHMMDTEKWETDLAGRREKTPMPNFIPDIPRKSTE